MANGPAMETVKCARCGIMFQARTADRKRGWAKYCSKECIFKPTIQENIKMPSSESLNDCRKEFEAEYMKHYGAETPPSFIQGSYMEPRQRAAYHFWQAGYNAKSREF